MRRWLVAGLLVIVAIMVWPYQPFKLEQNKITVPVGASAREIKKILVDNRIIPASSVFLLMVRGANLHDKIKAGDYLLSPADSLIKIILKLVVGTTVPQPQLKVTFPEGASIYKMGLILKAAGFTDWQSFQGLVDEGISAGLRERHRPLFRSIPSESLEGYLFPDTYLVFPDASVEVLAEAMIARFEEMALPLWQGLSQKAKLSRHEILTLASIIEKEAQAATERPMIASVFYNRLAAGMPLAADPTIKYALERPSKIVYLDQLSVRSPYNTYKRLGLPPGPICNPGLESIKAALKPAETNYFFFVAKKDGTHIFSRTWEEHQRAK